MDHNQDLSVLYDQITLERGKPHDFWEISALLEVFGIRDIDAQKDYGFENVFEMGKYMMRYIDTRTYKSKALVDWENLPPLVPRVLKNYIKGLAFAMPMFVQIFFTLTIGFALWSSITLDVETATAVALGTFLALIVTGSASQAIGRKGLFYLKQEEFVLASDVTILLFNIGAAMVVIVGIILILFNLFFNFLPNYYFFVLMAFYILLSILFLNISIYYMFEEYMNILYFFLIGMLLTYLSHTIFGITLPFAQFVALVILDIIISIFAFLKVRRLKKGVVSEGEGNPRASILFYSLMPFYAYGFAYFVFLTSDRIIAWSANIEAKPYFIWFNVPYELGLDWALISLIFMMGATEVSIHEFMYRINDLVVQYKYNKYIEFNEKVFHFFKKFNILYLILSVIIILLVFFIVYFVHKTTNYAGVDIFFQSFTPFVYWVGAISYAFMVNGLMNVLFMFSFSRQGFSLNSIVIAAIINIIVGIIFSRIFGLEYAVLGLLVGSIAFWFVSFKYALKMFKDLEFYYYSSF
ncbi:MAG TPA: hypothetical protein CFH84_07840 [Sulfurimonas sp. UBA12504]|nr:MAG: hypothetical protein A2019_07710 [Sulfurimonas sp. GWF2_37_8]DAB29712.1 MAG TPA: hypothetical protein CFH84_07840 [Sulfurimonas sp. UBA12504]